MLETIFGPPDQWPRQDLIAFSSEFDPGLAVMAYRSGVFPMPLGGADMPEEMGWWSPMERAQLPPELLRVTRSLRKSAKGYTTTVDVAFDDVMAQCAHPSRPDGWIDERIVDVFTALHLAGTVHSVETWDGQGRLVGGLYGIHQNGIFAGESMFHHPEHGRDASKVALMRLVVELRRCGVDLLDVQWLTPHLQTLGAVVTDREDYLAQLSDALAQPHRHAWSTGESSRLSGDELVSMLQDG